MVNTKPTGRFNAPIIPAYTSGLYHTAAKPLSVYKSIGLEQPLRISAEETRKRVKTGSALFVCAYDDDEKFQNNHLEGAISLGEFKTRLPSLAQDQEIIFYCA